MNNFKLAFDLSKTLLLEYLTEKQLNFNPNLSLTKPGDGNMNFVMRVSDGQHSVILKQANNYVEKYPQIAATNDRIQTEFSFYQSTAQTAIRAFHPKVLFFDEENRIMCLEDLGETHNLSQAYQDNRNLSQETINELVSYLIDLHRLQIEDYPLNLELRKLNHRHISVFPFEDNGLNLEPPLKEISKRIISNKYIIGQILNVGEIYLSSGNTLVHGDFYPGAWLATDQGLKIIDPEFSFLGFAEFDLGVFLAHLDFCQIPLAESFLNPYLEQFPKTNIKLMMDFRYLERMRRLMGLAQLPLGISILEKQNLLRNAENHFLN